MTKRYHSLFLSVWNLSPYVWGLLGFLVAYFVFFIVPTFFAGHVMQFFQYLPALDPVGYDLMQALSGSRAWFIEKRSPYIGTNPYPPLVSVLFTPLLFFDFYFSYKLITILNFLLFSAMTLLFPMIKRGWFNFPGKYVDTFWHLEKSGWLDSCSGAYQSVQDFLQGRSVRHSGQFQRAVPCPFAPLKQVVIPEQLQQGQQPAAHPPVNLQVWTQPTVQRFHQTGGTVKQTQDVPERSHDSLKFLRDVRTHVQLQFLSVIPGPQEKRLGLLVYSLEHRTQLLFQPFQRGEQLGYLLLQIVRKRHDLRVAEFLE
jgi:hypothetical protein